MPIVYSFTVPRSPNAALTARLQRVKDLSHDLARELARDQRATAAVRAMVDAIKQEIGVVHRALNRPKR